jgi:hypothetical protein
MARVIVRITLSVLDGKPVDAIHEKRSRVRLALKKTDAAKTTPHGRMVSGSFAWPDHEAFPGSVTWIL